MEPLLIFESYNFESLDRSWIKQVLDSSFTNIDSVPVDYLIFLESLDMTNLLKDTCEVVKEWKKQNCSREDVEQSEISESDTTEFSWQTLLSLNVDVQALHAVLSYLMKTGQAFDASQDSRQSGLRATSLYFILLSVPGSNTFRAFHPALYEIALKSLTLSQRLRDGGAHTKSRKLDYETLKDEGNDESEIFLTKSQSVTLTKGLNSVVYDLVTMLKSTSTSLESRSLERTVFYLVEMTQLAEETVGDFSLARKSEASTSSLAYNAYVALRLLCNEKYGSVSSITRLIGKYVLPQFVISVGATQLPAKRMAIVRDSTIHFLKTLLLKHTEESQLALTTLIQHLMIKPPERLEGRQKQAIVVIKLINLCEEVSEVYKNCLKDLVQLSHHNKISCRIFAQEIMGKFLLDLSNSRTNRKNEKNVWSSNDSKKLLLGAALNRCDDSSSMVRGRAIATFAEYTESIDSSEVQEIFKSETNEELSEMPSLEDLVDAIDQNDVSKVLPNSRGIIAMLRRRGEDERALVRRSSLQALRNGILVAPDLLKEGSSIIRQHCRDSALTVRRFAIRVLTTLLEKFPDNEVLCKDWVDSVVPRVFDAETKVNEEVLDSLEKLTILKIIQRRNNQQIVNLPWKILRELAANKMGDHLTKACSIWVNSGTITNATVANIKSHIGTENNVEAWLLMASIAEFRSLGNMTIYHSYYETALKDDGDDNGFLASLVIQVLRHCWPSFDEESLTIIRGDIIKYLEQYRVRVPLISHCLDILHGIDSFRGFLESSSTGATTMLNLMRLSEATIAKLVVIRDEDNLDDPGTLLFRATCVLGHSSFLCSEKISIDSIRILQGFLLEWNDLPAKVRERKELQAAAVTVLGQQSLRDREIAQEMTPIFGRLLRNTNDDTLNSKMASGPAVRINTAKALADICMRFTALVEPYLPDMCVSMKDVNPDVRQVILVIFIQLLAEDFIKINGPFFFNILSMLSDDDPTIRQMTVFLVKERLLSKNKSLVTQQFINCIFHFNDYERRNVGRTQRKGSAKERAALTFAGKKGLEERRLIYDFMLEHLDSPGKLTILVSLTSQILKSRNIASRTGLGELNIATDKGISVFKDALYVLSSEQLQPNSCGKQTGDDENLEDAPTTVTTPANSVVIEAMKKHRLEILLPGLVELKQRFAKAKSSLVVDIAIFLHKLLGDYNKDQLERLHNEWPELEKDIEQDIRECEPDERPDKARKSSTPKKSRVDTSLLINPKWIPRIVLRRISTLTYPDISELSVPRASVLSPENVSPQPQSPSTRGPPSPRKTRAFKDPETRS